jgi:hypothetical protein
LPALARSFSCMDLNSFSETSGPPPCRRLVTSHHAHHQTR